MYMPYTLKNQARLCLPRRRGYQHHAWEMHPRPPKRAGMLDEAEADILAYMAFPAHRPAIIHPTNPTLLSAGRFDPIKNRTKGALVHVLICL